VLINTVTSMEQTESFRGKETSKIIHMSILIILIAFNELISSFNMQSQEKKQIFILSKKQRFVSKLLNNIAIIKMIYFY